MPALGTLGQWATNIQSSLRNLANYNCLQVTNEGAPTSGTSGTGAGYCGIGALLTDVTNGKLYINTGTKASPTWTVVGAQT